MPVAENISGRGRTLIARTRGGRVLPYKSPHKYTISGNLGDFYRSASDARLLQRVVPQAIVRWRARSNCTVSRGSERLGAPGQRSHGGRPLLGQRRRRPADCVRPLCMRDRTPGRSAPRTSAIDCCDRVRPIANRRNMEKQTFNATGSMPRFSNLAKAMSDATSKPWHWKLIHD